jgi:large subunit ribosomal protein L6
MLVEKYYSQSGNKRMSRIGKQQIKIPAGVEVTFDAHAVRVKGPQGELVRALRDEVIFKIEDGTIISEPRRNDKFSRSLWGTYMSHLKNMITGVVTPFTKRLLVEGVGMKWDVKGTQLNLSLGFSHPVVKDIPAGLTVVAEKSALNITGVDKELVGLFANQVRSLKKPEPYKGKGIRYSDEVIRRKQGKKSA